MSRQYFEQLRSLESSYVSAYASLQSYCTGWRTWFNPKRWAVRRLLKRIDLLKTDNPSDIIHQAYKQIPSLANINPTSKLAAVFNVIQQKNQLDKKAQKILQKIIKLDEKNKESTVIKLLEKYSAWGVVRLFTGELKNAHVKEVRVLLKQYREEEIDYESLIHKIHDINTQKEDPLNDFKKNIGDESSLSQSELFKAARKEDADREDDQDSQHILADSVKQGSITASQDELKPKQENGPKEESLEELERKKLKHEAEQKEKEAQVKQEKLRKMELAKLQQEQEQEQREREELKKREELLKQQEELQRIELAKLEEEEKQREREEQVKKDELLKKAQLESEFLSKFSEEDLLKARDQLVEIKKNFESFLSIYNAPLYQREYPGCKPAVLKAVIQAFYVDVESKLAFNDLDLRRFLKDGFVDFVEWAAECEKQHQEFLKDYAKVRDQESSRLKLLSALKKRIPQTIVDLKSLDTLLNCECEMLGIAEELRVEKEKHLKAIIKMLKSYDDNAIKNCSFSQLQEIELWITSLPKELQLLKVDHQGNDLQRNYQDNSEKIQHEIVLINKMLAGLKDDVQYISFRQKIEFQHNFDIQELIKKSNNLLEESEAIVNGFKQVSVRSTMKSFNHLELLRALPEKIKTQREINSQFIKACKAEVERRKSVQAGAVQSNDNVDKQSVTLGSNL